MFQSYFSTKGAFETGLGMCLISEIASKHGFQLRAKSTKGEGTMFRISCRTARAESMHGTSVACLHGCKPFSAFGDALEVAFEPKTPLPKTAYSEKGFPNASTAVLGGRLTCPTTSQG